MPDTVDAVILRKVAGRYLIYYRHGLAETLVDQSDDEFPAEYLLWRGAAAEHARDNAAEFIDKTPGED